MFDNFRFHLAVFLVPVFLTACASGPSVDTQEKKAVVERLYTTAHIGKISSALLDDKDPDEKRLADKKTVEAQLPKVLKEALEDNGFAVPADMTANKSGAVVINLDIQYDPGNRALRWTAGIFGAGKGFVKGKIEAVDATTGVVIASRSDEDATRMGAFGGDFYGSINDMAESLVEDLAEDLDAKSK